MKVNIENCVMQIRNARAKKETDGNVFVVGEFVVGELVEHMKQVRDRVLAGDNTAIDDFFGLYVFSDDVVYEPMFGEEKKC